MPEAVLKDYCMRNKLDQSCGGTVPSGDQSVTKSSSKYHSGSSTDISLTHQPDKSMHVSGTAAASHSHDLKQVDGTMRSMKHTDSNKWPNLKSCKSDILKCTNHMITTEYK